MKVTGISVKCLLLAATAWLLLGGTVARALIDPDVPRLEMWQLQSGCLVHEPGSRLSTPEYRAEGWIPALVPGTVLGSQVAAGIFADPFFGMHLRQIPGTDYPLGKIFGYLPMSADSPYRCPWWYRTTFDLPEAAGRFVQLHFDGINYRANIWLNGTQLASSDEIAGAFRSYDLDITKQARRGKQNVLAVEVFAQTENDLGIDFLDWNPAPADKSLGLWRNVSLLTSGPVSVSHPAVSSHFLKSDLSVVDLEIVADVVNHDTHAVKARVRAAFGGRELDQDVDLAAGEAKAIHFDATMFPLLRVSKPRVWWPFQYGEPYLQTLEMTAYVDGRVFDTTIARFGIREITAALNSHGYLQFQVNRRNLFIRGAGWTPDLFYREPRARLRQELAYVKDMRLNTIRLEGKLGSDDLFDLADEMGILVMAGWQCCDRWQQWAKWTPAEHTIAAASLYSQISRLRIHPSLLAWLNGSDEAPSPQAEAEALAVLHERGWPNPIMSAASDRTSTITGKTGVKMSGPYDYVPPEYWYLDTSKAGGAFGFNTETSPGPAIPTAASVRRTLPQASWWPIDEQWKYHAGLGKFAQYSNFTNAMDATYGPASTLAEYTLQAQLMAYDGERAMFESYAGHKYQATGVIQWMLNNAWPSFIWHLYDYYLVPGGGYFGARKANEALHIQFAYDDRRVSVVNATLASYRGLHATATLLNLAGRVLFAKERSLDIAADGVAPLFAIPAQSATVFLELRVSDAQGNVLSRNFYWIPAALARMDWAKTTYVNTPAIRYADMRDLRTLSKAPLEVVAGPGKEAGELSVRLTNRGKVVAFFLQLRLVKQATDEEVAPVFWSENYVSLLPGESRVLTARYPLNTAVSVKLEGWNVKAQTTTLADDAIHAARTIDQRAGGVEPEN